MGHDHLDGDRRLATLPLGCRRTGAVLYLGFTGDRAATIHHGDELGETIIHKTLVLPLVLLIGSFARADDTPDVLFYLKGADVARDAGTMYSECVLW